MFIPNKHCYNKEIRDTNRTLLTFEKCYSLKDLMVYEYNTHLLHFGNTQMISAINVSNISLTHCLSPSLYHQIHTDVALLLPDWVRHWNRNSSEQQNTVRWLLRSSGCFLGPVWTDGGKSSTGTVEFILSGLEEEKRPDILKDSQLGFFPLLFCMFREYLLWGFWENIWNKCAAIAQVIKSFW